MALFFSCVCGQNLRADENQAGGHTRCPACGRFARVPSLYRANGARGGDSASDQAVPAPQNAIPPLPVPRLKVVEVARTESVPQRPLPPPAEGPAVYAVLEEPQQEGLEKVRIQINRETVVKVLSEARRELKERRLRHTSWPVEKHWHQALEYPMRAWVLVGGLAAVWGTATTFLWLIFPETWNLAELMPRFPLLLFAFLLVGYTCAGLQATLVAGRAGEAGYVAWPERSLARTVRSGAEAVLCFLAGPILPALVGFWFWVNSGDLLLVDWLILWELGIVAMGYWILAMLAVQETGRLRDVNPLAVLKLVYRQGYRPVLATVLMGAALVGHGLLVLEALEELHRSPRGWLMLVGSWGGTFFWVILLLRWLGVSLYRVRKAARQRRDQTPSAGNEPARFQSGAVALPTPALR